MHCYFSSEVKVDCVVVSTGPVKTAIDDLLQRLYDTLTFTLRHSIQVDLHQATQFLSDAIGTLSSRPQTVDEVAEANTKHHEFGKQKPLVTQSAIQSNSIGNSRKQVCFGSSFPTFS